MRSLTVIATTGDGFEHLGPYVASINEVGEVAFQATRAAGAGIFFSDGRGTKELFGPPRLQDVTSHPDINGARATAFYGELELGRPAVVVSEERHLYAIAEADGNRFASIGPAGPTMNGSGAVAFRAERSDGASGLYLANRESVAVVAETDERWARFHGLPLVNERRAVVFRADRHDGRQGIYAWREGATRSIVETGTSFETISLFPSASNGVIAFAATLSEGGAAVFTAEPKRITRVVDPGEPFESYRGALISTAGVVRIATPNGGTLGLFEGPDPDAGRILAIGDELQGSTVRDLAANPVSVNARGDIAIVVTLSDDRQLVVRSDAGRGG